MKLLPRKSGLWLLAFGGVAAVVAYIKKISLLGLVFLMMALLQGTKVTHLAEAESLDHQWVARVTYEDYPSMFARPAYVVDLQPSGTFGRWRKERVLVMNDTGSDMPSVAWNKSNELLITAAVSKKNVLYIEPMYQDVVIRLSGE